MGHAKVTGGQVGGVAAGVDELSKQTDCSQAPATTEHCARRCAGDTGDGRGDRIPEGRGDRDRRGPRGHSCFGVLTEIITNQSKSVLGRPDSRFPAAPSPLPGWPTTPFNLIAAGDKMLLRVNNESQIEASSWP
ncbi:hypothetical protein BgiBS90_032602 [Biomphalaria glabrata]|nr:hypothetical protein BgiBS90_032602 [Biomphalaria glabrata]